MLVNACSRGDLELAQELNGGDTKVWIDYFKTYTMLCIRRGRLNLMKWLIEDLLILNECSDRSKAKMISKAARNGFTEIVELLIENGVSVEHTKGQPGVFHFAAMSGNVETVAMLYERGIPTQHFFNKPWPRNQTGRSMVFTIHPTEIKVCTGLWLPRNKMS